MVTLLLCRRCTVSGTAPQIFYAEGLRRRQSAPDLLRREPQSRSKVPRQRIDFASCLDDALRKNSDLSDGNQRYRHQALERKRERVMETNRHWKDNRSHLKDGCNSSDC